MANEAVATVVQFPQRDTGTQTVSQRNEPETVESPADNASTGAVTGPPSEATYTSLEHLDAATGAAKQISAPVTTHADWPGPSDAPQPSEHQAAPQEIESPAPEQATKPSARKSAKKGA